MKKVIICYLVLELCGLLCEYFLKNIINVQLYIWVRYLSMFSIAFLSCFLNFKTIRMHNLKTPSLKSTLAVIPISLCLSMLAVCVIKLSMLHISKVEQPLSTTQHFILAVIMAPIIEELFFRYILLHKLLKVGVSNQIYNKLAVIFIACLFGLAHWSFGLTTMVYTFICGIGYGLIYLYSKNIILCIIAHMFNNLIAFLVSLPAHNTNNSVNNNWQNLISISIWGIVLSFIIYTLLPFIKPQHSRN